MYNEFLDSTQVKRIFILWVRLTSPMEGLTLLSEGFLAGKITIPPVLRSCCVNYSYLFSDVKTCS
jgi:hypothetical protein